MADDERKAGNRQRAAAIIAARRERQGYGFWPDRHPAAPHDLARAVASVVCHQAPDPR